MTCEALNERISWAIDMVKFFQVNISVNIGFARVGAASVVFSVGTYYHTVSGDRNRLTEIVSRSGTVGVGIIESLQQAASRHVKNIGFARI